MPNYDELMLVYSQLDSRVFMCSLALAPGRCTAGKYVRVSAMLQIFNERVDPSIFFLVFACNSQSRVLRGRQRKTWCISILLSFFGLRCL